MTIIMSVGQDNPNELDFQWISQMVAELQYSEDAGSYLLAYMQPLIGPMGKWPWLCTFASQVNHDKFDLKKNGPMELESLQGAEPYCFAHRKANGHMTMTLHISLSW